MRWDVARLLWIAHLKNNNNDECFLGKLPKDIIKYIICFEHCPITNKEIESDWTRIDNYDEVYEELESIIPIVNQSIICVGTCISIAVVNAVPLIFRIIKNGRIVVWALIAVIFFCLLGSIQVPSLIKQIYQIKSLKKEQLLQIFIKIQINHKLL